ncbi:MAG: hypothetical protein ACP5OP_04010 [Leptospirillia bacterium]
MAILPVVGLEQVIAQSPALVSERVRDQKKEEGPPVTEAPRVPKDTTGTPPVEGVRPVDPVGAESGTEDEVEKEKESEYSVEKRGRLPGRKRSPGGRSSRHRLDIRA